MLLRYAQNVHLNENDTENIKKISYMLFPKLLFDDLFFDMNYETSFFLHGIMLPSDKIIQEYKKNCTQKMDYYIKNVKPMIYPYIVEDLKKKEKGKNNKDLNIESKIKMKHNFKKPKRKLCSSINLNQKNNIELKQNDKTKVKNMRNMKNIFYCLQIY